MYDIGKRLWGILIIVAVAGCVKPQGGGSPGANEDGLTFAVVNGNEIKGKDVLDKIRGDLLDMKRNEYELKRRATEEIIQQRLLDDEAKKQGTTVEKLFTPFDSIKEKEVSKEDIQGFLKEKGIDEKKLSKQERESVPQIIKMQRMYEARQNYVRELRNKANVQFKIPKPEEPKLNVTKGSMPPLGPSNAKVTIIEFSDFECPFCARGRARLEEIRKKYGSKVSFYFRHFPLESIHPWAYQGSEAAVCANEQGKFWQMHDALFDFATPYHDQHKEIPTDDFKKVLPKIVRDIGLDDKAFNDCVKSGKAQAVIRKDQEEGAKLGLNSTPTFFVEGKVIRGAQPLESFSDAIDDALGH